MSAENTKGKITNKDSGESLAFSLNPTEVRIARNFDLAIEPCVGAPSPVVAFRCGGAAVLSFQVKFDKDADNQCDPAKVETFLKALNKIKDATRSAPKIEFHLGKLTFMGFVSTFTTVRHRFDDKGDATSLSLDMSVVSTGEYENES
jgi:hypothetical protein